MASIPNNNGDSSKNGISKIEIGKTTSEKYDPSTREVAYARIWQQRTDESDIAYDAFKTYLAMKSENHSYPMTDIANACMKSSSMLWRWHKQYEWQNRLQAYQNNEMLILEREMRQHAKADAGLWYERKKIIRERGFELGNQLLDRAALLLKLPVSEKVIDKTIEVAGQKVETHTTLNFNQHPRDARLFLETGVKLMRLSADMPTDHINLMPEDKDLDAMTDEELKAYADILEATRKELISSNGDGGF